MLNVKCSMARARECFAFGCDSPVLCVNKTVSVCGGGECRGDRH